MLQNRETLITIDSDNVMARDNIICPICQTSTHVHVVYSIGNLLRHFANGFIFGSLVKAHGMPLLSINVLYTCTSCGNIFTLKASKSQNLLCAQCRYNLTGNKSGICPECGQNIPEHLKKHILSNSIPDNSD